VFTEQSVETNHKLKQRYRLKLEKFLSVEQVMNLLEKHVKSGAIETTGDIIERLQEELTKQASSNLNERGVSKIVPLKWEGELKGEYSSIEAKTPFGSYSVTQFEKGRLNWRYCFDEYEMECKSVEDGKLKASQHWKERIFDVLY